MIISLIVCAVFPAAAYPLFSKPLCRSLPSVTNSTTYLASKIYLLFFSSCLAKSRDYQISLWFLFHSSFYFQSSPITITWVDNTHLLCYCMLSHFSCVWLCDLMDCSLPGSSVCGILQARLLKCVAISSSRVSSQPRNQTCISCVPCIGRQVLYH